MSPPIALKPNVAVGADEKKRVGDMRQVIARVGAWKLGSEGARYVGGGPAVQDVIVGRVYGRHRQPFAVIGPEPRPVPR